MTLIVIGVLVILFTLFRLFQLFVGDESVPLVAVVAVQPVVVLLLTIGVLLIVGGLWWVRL